MGRFALYALYCRNPMELNRNNSRHKHDLNSKTLAATARAACIGVAKIKTLSIQPIGEIKCCIDQIQKALQIGNNLYPIIFKHLVHRF